jgi:hypothetical protein
VRGVCGRGREGCLAPPPGVDAWKPCSGRGRHRTRCAVAVADRRGCPLRRALAPAGRAESRRGILRRGEGWPASWDVLRRGCCTAPRRRPASPLHGCTARGHNKQKPRQGSGARWVMFVAITGLPISPKRKPTTPTPSRAVGCALPEDPHEKAPRRSGPQITAAHRTNVWRKVTRPAPAQSLLTTSPGHPPPPRSADWGRVSRYCRADAVPLQATRMKAHVPTCNPRN